MFSSMPSPATPRMRRSCTQSPTKSSNGEEDEIDIFAKSIEAFHRSKKETLVVKFILDGIYRSIDFSKRAAKANKIRLVEKSFYDASYGDHGLQIGDVVMVYHQGVKGKPDAGFYEASVLSYCPDGDSALDFIKAHKGKGAPVKRKSHNSGEQRRKSHAGILEQLDEPSRVDDSLTDIGSTSIQANNSGLNDSTSSVADEFVDMDESDATACIQVGKKRSDGCTLSGPPEHTSNSGSCVDQEPAQGSMSGRVMAPQILLDSTEAGIGVAQTDNVGGLTYANVNGQSKAAGNALTARKAPPLPAGFRPARANLATLPRRDVPCAAAGPSARPKSPRAASRSDGDQNGFYWKEMGKGQLALRDGYSVFVYSTILKDLKKRFGPQVGKGWHKYDWKVVHHLLGGDVAIAKIKRKGMGVDAMLGDDIIETVIGHVEELFDLSTDSNLFKHVCNRNIAQLVLRQHVKQAKEAAVADPSTQTY